MQPLVFTPFLRPMPWGGRRLGDALGKPLPPDGTWGESWELSAHPMHVSRVAEGPLAGTPLTELLPGFPLLVKYLDANDWLSVQVHPDDDKAMSLSGEPLGKTEAWVVLGVEPGGRVFAGFKPGVGRADFERALAEKRAADCLHAFTPAVGDCLFYPAGTVHAVGGGVLLAEVQQSSDATLRLYDWDRVGADGKPRPLHVAQALEAIDWARGPVKPVVGKPLPGVPGERLVECRYFAMDRFRVTGDLPSPYRDRLSLWMVLGGAAELRAAGGYRRAFGRGGTVVVPGDARDVIWHAAPGATLLGVTLPAGR
jgi:mannose-6-phosphate isomerase